MRLTKTSWWILTIGVFIIAFAGLGVVCYHQVQQQNQLNEELTLAQLELKELELEQLSAQQTELEGQLNQATSQFEAIKAVFSQPIKSVAASSILFDIAEAYDLEITQMTSPGPASDTLEGITCSVISLTATVEGDVPNLVGFVTKLNGQLPTGVVQSITITVPETASGEKASANIQLVIYTYQGD